VAEPSLLLWDIGGVVLSNAWDHVARKAAVQRFDLDASDLERRHERVVVEFETGRMDLERYLAETVFYVPRAFTRGDFVQFMHERSTPIGSVLSVARELRRRGGVLMAALNNESRELNEFRIQTFHLTDAFDLFLTSCYTGRRKPELAAYEHALELTQRAPHETLFLDDRPENIEAASRLGLSTILVQDPGRLAGELNAFGITAE
jgi:putative hydrolase of the HAD superfamily